MRDKRIRALHAQAQPVKAIARQLSLCPKTVRRVLGKQMRAKERKPSKLDDYRAVVRYRALESGWQAREIFKYIKGLGYDGGESILKEYVRAIRPKPPRRPALRFETAAGVQGQVDLSPYEVMLGRTLTPVVCFSFVLCFSRWRFFFFVREADRFTVMLCHRLAFEELGGLPATILYDRMKQVVIAVIKGEPLLQDDFARLVAHYDFTVCVLEAGYKEGKGKVEKPFQDVEAFLGHHAFHSLDDLNAQALVWRRNELHATPHRTTGEKPCDRLVLERPHLQELPGEPFRCEQRQRCHTGKHFHVEHLGRFYSVPPQFADRWVTRCLLNGRLWVEADGEVISEHEICDSGPKFRTLPEHAAAFREMGTSKQSMRKYFASLGPAAERFASGLDRTQGGASTFHMSRIIELVKRIGRERVVDALRYATRYEAFNHTQVARIAQIRRLRATTAAVEEALAKADDSHSLGDDRHDLARGHQRSLLQYETLIRDKARTKGSEQDDDGQ